MKLVTALLGDDPGWRTLLVQEGLPFVTVNDTDSFQDVTIVIVPDAVKPGELEPVRMYLRGGGAVLCSGKIHALLTGLPSVERYVKYVFPGRESRFSGCGIIDVHGTCYLPQNANELSTEDMRGACFFGECEGGLVAALPFDAGLIMRDHRVCAKSFLAQRGRLPHERVSMVSKGSVRKLARRALELLHHARNLPFGHLWYYPRNSASVFVLRIDADIAEKADFDRLLEVSAKRKIPFSWFLHVKFQEPFLRSLSEMTGQEIGVHCYEHIRYTDFQSASNDIRRALEVLSGADIRPAGMCTPFGEWHDDVSRAIETFGFEYSSEFSYDYDNLPSYPVLADGLGMTLQMPVHPISIGNLRRQSFSEVEMKMYYAALVERGLSTGDPLLLYHHPKNGHDQVLEELVARIQKLNVAILRMIDYARWWKKRIACTVAFDVQDSKLVISGKACADDVWIHLTQSDGTEAYSPIVPSLDLQQLPWTGKQAPVDLSDDVSRIRKSNPWIFINHVEDEISNFFNSIK